MGKRKYRGYGSNIWHEVYKKNADAAIYYTRKCTPLMRIEFLGSGNLYSIYLWKRILVGDHGLILPSLPK